MLKQPGLIQVFWLCTLIGAFSQPGNMLGRLQQYHQAYNRWASQRTFIWEIDYQSSLNKTRLMQNLRDEKLREAISRTPSDMQSVFRLEIKRTPRLNAVILEHIGGFWPPDTAKAYRTYRGSDWLSMEVGEARDGEGRQKIPLVQIMPIPETGSVLFHPYELTGFLYQMHPSFFAASNPFEEAFCCEPRLKWQVEKVQADTVWLRSQGWQGKEVAYRLGYHLPGKLKEYQMIYKGQVRHRIRVMEYQQHGKFYVPSFVVIEWQTPSE
ncbi:MAG: hypothetical protein WHT28_03225, partial [Fimbriimonadales bacterium]